MNAKLGRPKSDNTRNKNLSLRLRQDELELIQRMFRKIKFNKDWYNYGRYKKIEGWTRE